MLGVGQGVGYFDLHLFLIFVFVLGARLRTLFRLIIHLILVSFNLVVYLVADITYLVLGFLKFSILFQQ